MNRQPFVLSFQQSQVYEVGAALLVRLACPKEKSETRLGDLHASLCAKALWLQHLSDIDNATPITVKPQHVFRDPKLIDRHISFISKRLGERLVAARMMIQFLQRAKLGHMPKLPSAIERLSINQMAEFVLDDAGQSDANNVKHRFWAPSRPVIHLAAAALIVGQEANKQKTPFYLESFLLCRELIEEIVRGAEQFEDLIASGPKGSVKIDNLIRVRLV